MEIIDLRIEQKKDLLNKNRDLIFRLSNIYNNKAL